jgi:DegV family protein with EDD domain
MDKITWGLETGMEQTIRVVTDSSCDLPPQRLKELRIEVVPLTVRFGTDVYRDGDLSVEQFWEMASGPHHPQTSQPAVGAFEEVFRRLVDLGSRVLCLTITSKHSGTFNAAHLAAEHFGEAVKVFDSLSVSLGLGLQALSAAQAAGAGRSMQEILTLLEDLRARMSLLIVLDTLENLRLGGRADGFIALADRMTRVLDVKVIINMMDGQLRLLSAARAFHGALKRVLALVERMGPLEHLAVIHARNQEAAGETAEQLAQRIGYPKELIWLQETGAALATHAGPGVVGVLAVPIGSTG